jgi:ferric-dicitrate binding protein FerR (iron transport regulator)
VVRRLLIAASVAAACVAMFYISGWQRSSDDVQLVNESQEAREQVLPDQSIVVLSPGATVLYNSKTYLTDRKVKLKGRAFFEVEKGSPFAVISAQGVVEVLGTSFDVNAISQQYKVACYTGKVKVSYAQYKVTLTPGERTAFNENKEHKVQFDLPAGLQPDWLSTYIAFENESLQKVIKEIEIIYGVKVEIEPSLLLGVKHTGHVVKDDIDKALTSITWPHHMTFELEGEVVKIVQKVE